MFDFQAINSFGGIFDVGHAVLPVRRYIVTNDILVKPNAKLTIQAGTELRFLNGVGMLVLGELSVEGLDGSNVRFSLADQRLAVEGWRSEMNERLEFYESSTMRMPSLVGNWSGQMNGTEVEQAHLVDDSWWWWMEGRGLKNNGYPKLTLEEGRNEFEGRLHIQVSPESPSGTICNRAWSVQNSQIACQQMGLMLDPDLPFYRHQPSHPTRAPIVLSEVQCDPLDTNLLSCRHTKQADHTCLHEDDIWLKCLPPTWAGIRLGLHAQPSRLAYATFTNTGQYDYALPQLQAALQIDLNNKHHLTNLTFTNNQAASLEILLNQPHNMHRKGLTNLYFVSNSGPGLVTRTSFLRADQIFANDNFFQAAVEYNPIFTRRTLNELRLFSQEPRRGTDVRKELTRLINNAWHIGSEEMVMLYTDTEYQFGPKQLNIQIQTDNNRVLIIDLIDYNTDFTQEKVLFCEKFCQHSYTDPAHRQWNLSSIESAAIHFPLNTSYSAIHISYNITNIKSGRLAFLVYSVAAPEPVFDYLNPSFIYIRNIMPDNQIIINNSSFTNNRHAIVVRHYDHVLDIFGNIRRRYNYSNIVLANSTFNNNDQVLWINTDPVIANTHYKLAASRIIHQMHQFEESDKDDNLIRESGYEMFDLVPVVKLGPLGLVNITVEDSVFEGNFGGLRFVYRYYEYSNALWHFEIRNNRWRDGDWSAMRLVMPRVDRFSAKGSWINGSHSLVVRNNEFSANRKFGIIVSGYYSQINITRNLFVDNDCHYGLLKFNGGEKAYFIYKNLIEHNTAPYILDMSAESHATIFSSTRSFRSLFVDNTVQDNRPPSKITFRSEVTSPNSYTLALRGLQNTTFGQNILNNPKYEYEFVAAMTTNTLNSTLDVTGNWWAIRDPTTIARHRIFDFGHWNNHARANFVPFCADSRCESLSRGQPDQKPLILNMTVGKFVLGGCVSESLTLIRTPIPYQVTSDVTVMPGATLTIERGVEMEFMPNIGILVLGNLQADGTESQRIEMRPMMRRMDRDVDEVMIKTSIPTNPHMRLFSGPSPTQGFLQIYNETLREWTWLCDEHLTRHTASLACREMGLEHRNVLVQAIYHYRAPWQTFPVWNQTFICQSDASDLQSCHTFANYKISECEAQGHFTYLMCNDYKLTETTKYQGAWAGIRFARPYFEKSSSIYEINAPQSPIFVKQDMVEEQQDSSFLNFVQIVGAGRLHGQRSPAVQLINRSPFINNCNITLSEEHGLEVVQPTSTITLNNLRISHSQGYAVNMLMLNTQTTDQRSSFRPLIDNTLSESGSLFSMIDICDPHKFYDLDQRALLFYKYSDNARDCLKIFRTRMSPGNLGSTGQIGFRLLQFMLANNTAQEDTLDIFNATNQLDKTTLIQSFSNGSDQSQLNMFYLSRTDSLAVLIKASPGREYFGFIAEVLIYPTSQYLSSENFVELSDSQMEFNQLGALRYVTTGERSPSLYVLRNRIVNNGIAYFNSTTPPCIDTFVQNTPKFQFGNNYIGSNYGGGLLVKLYSGSGVLITSTIIYNNVFVNNLNGTVVGCEGETDLPYNELVVDKNFLLRNEAPRSFLMSVSGLLSKVTRNQIVGNEASHMLFTQGFVNVSAPRSQETAFNLFKDNYAYGLINDLEQANRFRSTMVAASLKQTYHANYMFNEKNDFELTSLEDPLILGYLEAEKEQWDTRRDDYYGWDEVRGKLVKDERYIDLNIVGPVFGTEQKSSSVFRKPTSLQGMIAFTGTINASLNYWGTAVDSEIRARIRDKYDSPTLFEVTYSPAILDRFELRDGKCQLGWSLIEDTCYTYVGAHTTYSEASKICQSFDSQLARETTVPIRLPQFRRLARTSQFNYDAQSYRRMWLHTDHLLNGDPRMCTTIQDFGRSSTQCNHLLPFICEKDPFFHGAAFRFKDEVAFAISATGALLVCVILLCLLWLYKSRNRKKQHMDRQHTLRSSARSHRHMMSSTNSSNITSSSVSRARVHRHLNGNFSQTQLYNTASGDDLSTNTFSFGAGGGGTRSVGGASIYASQRNQYFMNKKNRQSNGNESRVLDNLPANKIVNDNEQDDWVCEKLINFILA